MNKLLSVLIAAVFAAVTFSAVAADAPKAAAPAAETTTTTTTTTAAPAMHKKRVKTAKDMKMTGCRKDAKGQNLKGDKRKAFIKDCMSKEDAPAAPAAKEVAPAAKK